MAGVRWGMTTGGAVRTAPATRVRLAVILGVATIVVGVDQITKTWALHHTVSPIHVIWTLRLALTFNSGAAFSLGRGATPIVETAAVVLVVALLVFGRRASRTASVPVVVAFGLLVGGACGNLCDRIFRHHQGAVIDFVDLRWWPVFNVADAAITVGVVALVSFWSFPGRRRGAPGERPGHRDHRVSP